TIVYLLTKPIPRWRTALAKTLVAVVVTLVLTLPPLLLTGLLVSGTGADSIRGTSGYVVAAALGGAAYPAVFTPLGALPAPALIPGRAYTLIWEGVLAGLLEGTRYLSIRQATLGVAAALSGTEPGREPLAPMVSFVILVVAIVGGYAVTTSALRRFQI